MIKLRGLPTPNRYLFYTPGQIQVNATITCATIVKVILASHVKPHAGYYPIDSRWTPKHEVRLHFRAKTNKTGF